MDPTCCIFVHSAKNACLQIFAYILLTNSPINIKFGMLVHFEGMYVHINYQMPTSYTLGDIAKRWILGANLGAILGSNIVFLEVYVCVCVWGGGHGENMGMLLNIT